MNIFKQASVIAFVAVILITSCKKDPEDENKELEAQTYTNVSYGSHPSQKMDVYLPGKRSSSTPVVVLLHGGGFFAGDKGEFSQRATELSAKGYVVLNVNYRLVDSTGALSIPVVHKPSAVKIADQLNDVNAAVNFAVGKSNEWIMSTDRWGMTGHSAGATLSLLYSYGKNTNKRIKVAGNWAGATNFAFTDESEADSLDPRLVEILYRAVGAEIKNENKLAYMAVSAYWVANTSAIPTVNIRPENNGGDNDKAEYQKLTDLLNSRSVPNKWVEVAGADHGFSQAGSWTKVINETDAFFGIYLK